jgi:uncharacterized protein
MQQSGGISRRSTLKTIGAGGALSLFGGDAAQGTDLRYYSREVRRDIFEKVFTTPFIDTHEHLVEESDRLMGAEHPRIACDDWAFLCNHYLNSDLLSAGMPKQDQDQLFSPNIDPMDKWRLLAPWWPYAKHTGYGQAVRISLQALYDVDDFTTDTISKIQDGYARTRRAGFYEKILRDVSGIESCQVNCLTGAPFCESAMPTMLMQDISIVGMFSGPQVSKYAGPAGIDVRNIGDWYRVINWWFDTYAKYAVAVKSQNAYSRDIDYDQVSRETADPLFNRRLMEQSLSNGEKKALEDHLFWYAVEQATAHNLPVKLHTGYYAGANRMPLSRLAHNAGSACDLCKAAPDSRFVFMHINYPNYEELITVAKQYTNAYLDMCWAWIMNPVASKDFLKKYLMTAPANKILTFGGDYIPVEIVPGHAIIARRGIAQALSELVDEGWLRESEAIDLVDPIMHGNARRIFNLEEKERLLRTAPWL